MKHVWSPAPRAWLSVSWRNSNLDIQRALYGEFGFEDDLDFLVLMNDCEFDSAWFISYACIGKIESTLTHMVSNKIIKAKSHRFSKRQIMLFMVVIIYHGGNFKRRSYAEWFKRLAKAYACA